MITLQQMHVWLREGGFPGILPYRGGCGNLCNHPVIKSLLGLQLGLKLSRIRFWAYSWAIRWGIRLRHSWINLHRRAIEARVDRVQLHKLNKWTIPHAEQAMHSNAESRVLRISRGTR